MAELADVKAGQQVNVETGDGQKIIIPVPGDKHLAIARTPNRAERRRMEREQTGFRGTKAKRHKGVSDALTAKEVTEAEAAFLAEQKVIESARNIREATRGGFWLPGDKA